MNYYVTGKQGSVRPAKLKDMLQPERDIVLYLDDNLYNIDKIAEMQGMNYTRLANTEEAGTDNSNQSLGEKVETWWEGVVDTDIETIA